MAVGLLVRSHWEFRDVSPHHISGQIKVDVLPPRTPLLPFMESDFLCVGNEINRKLPRSPILPLAAKVVFLFKRKTVFKYEIVVKDEIHAVKKIHDERGISNGKIPRRSVTLAIEMLVTGIQGNRK